MTNWKAFSCIHIPLQRSSHWLLAILKYACLQRR